MIGGRELVSVGVNHATAPVEVRERLAIDQAAIGEHFLALSKGLSHESVILSTCNRVEVYAVVDESDMGEGIAAYLARRHGLSLRELEAHIYRFNGPEAVSHLFRVAASLDSQVVGEPQILGQVKNAFQVAREHGSAGRILQPLMRRTVTVAKRVRTQTAIGRVGVSVGSAGVELARQVFGDLDKRRTLMLGAGEMGRLVARALLSQGVSELVVVNRTYDRASDLARDFGATAVHMDQLDSYLEQVDIGIVSTGSREHLITRERLAPIMRKRRYRPLFLVDLSVPRNVAPDVNKLEGAYLFNVDDLTEVARRGLARRQVEAEKAERMVQDEAIRCYRSLGGRSADEVIGNITRHAEHARQAELERSHALLERMDPKDRKIIEAMTRSMFKRFLHTPIHQARSLGESGDEEGLRVLGDAFGNDQEKR